MSMRRRLLFWLLSSVLAGGLAAAVVVFFQARSEANDLFDYQLRQLALTLRDRTFSAREFAEALAGEEASDFVIQVWGRDGTRLYVSHPQLQVPGAVQLGFSNLETPDGRWRVFAIQQRGLTSRSPRRGARSSPSWWRSRSWASSSGGWWATR